MQDLLKMLDLSKEDIATVLDLADQLKYDQHHNIPHRYLEGKTLAMIFAKNSTRTRVSFESGMFQMGGQAVYLNARESIAENIAITSPQTDLKEVRRAARAACLERTVDEFPSSFDTFVGERGVTLSGGQKQRAAIARTLTQHAPILIFDDSLSAVDAETDAEIRANLNRYMGKATVILISHRITTLRAADQILVLENGRITQRGTHQQLAAQPGLYRTICEIQEGKEGTEDA